MPYSVLPAAAVHHLDADEAALAAPAAGRARARLRRHHRVEQRQRDRRAHAAQHRAPGQVLLRDEHRLRLPRSCCYRARLARAVVGRRARHRACRIWNGTLVTTPITNDENGSRRFAASRDDGAHRGHVVRVEHAAQPVAQQVFGEAGDERVGVRQQRRAQARPGRRAPCRRRAAPRDRPARRCRWCARGRWRRSSRAPGRSGPSCCGRRRTPGSCDALPAARAPAAPSRSRRSPASGGTFGGRRRRRRAQQHLHHVLAAHHRRGAVGQRGQRQDAAVAEQAAAIRVGDRHAPERGCRPRSGCRSAAPAPRRRRCSRRSAGRATAAVLAHDAVEEQLRLARHRLRRGCA